MSCRIIPTCTLKSETHNCAIFYHKDLTLFLLPSLFSKAVANKGITWSKIKGFDKDGMRRDQIDENDIPDSGQTDIHNKLKNFFNWIVSYSKENEKVSLDRHHNFPEEILNYFLNDYLVGEKKSSTISINKYLRALRGYYDYLAMTGFTNSKNLFLYPDYKEAARRNTKSRTSVKYLSLALRTILYRNTTSLKDELLLRSAGEIGLRSKENQGLVLNDFTVGGKRYPGFKSLFKQMDEECEQQEFQFHLQSKFTKGGSKARSRTLYIHRTLLVKYKRYFDEERPASTSDTLLVSNSNANRGDPITERSASEAFTKTKNIVLAMQERGELEGAGQALDDDHTHHVLRHSSITDFFYDKSKKSNIAFDDVTTTSQVYLATAKFAGHKVDNKYSASTTKEYIHSCWERERLEQGNVDA